MEAHGTGTSLGDPVEIGSISGVLGSTGVTVASLKGNIGHMEGTAGTGGLLNLVGAILHRGTGSNVQLRRLNVNLQNIIAGESVTMVTDFLIGESIGGVSSFGATGIIAHTLLQYVEVSNSDLRLFIPKEASGYDSSLFRLETTRPLETTRRLYMIPVSGKQLSLVLDAARKLVSVGSLSFSANAGFSDHVIDGKVLLPGVGYIEMASSSNTDPFVLTTVIFLRPCVLTEFPAQRVLRKKRQNTGIFEISSLKTTEMFVVHAVGKQENNTGASTAAVQTYICFTRQTDAIVTRMSKRADMSRLLLLDMRRRAFLPAIIGVAAPGDWSLYSPLKTPSSRTATVQLIDGLANALLSNPSLTALFYTTVQ